MKKFAIGTISSLTALGAAAFGTSAFLYKAGMKAKKGLSHFVILPDENKNIDLSKVQKINYVALGDSLTSGYNDVLGEDADSFADYIKANLKKAGRLNSYYNAAKTGHMIFDTQKMVTQKLTTAREVQKADLITISVGANDLLKYAKVLDLPFSTLASQEMMEIKNNEYRMKHAPSSLKTTQDWEIYDAVANSIDMLQNSIKTNDYSGSIHLQPKLEKTILDLIERNMQLLVHDINSVAPNARIVIISHPNPFVNFNDSLLDNPIKQNKNKNLKHFYDKYKKALSSSAEGRDFIDVIDLDSLSELVDNKEEITLSDGTKRKRTFPNTFAIHPSLYGHEIIGNSIFKGLISNLLNIQKPQQYLTHGKTEAENTRNPYIPSNDFQPIFFDQFEENEKNFLVDKFLRKIVNNFNKDKPLENNLMFKVLSSLNELYEIYINGAYRSKKLVKVDETASIKMQYSAEKSYKIDDIGDIINRIISTDKEKLEYGFQKILARLIILMYPILTNQELNSQVKFWFDDFKDKKLLTSKQLETLKPIISAMPDEIRNNPFSSTFIYNFKGDRINTLEYGAKNVEELNDKYRVSYFINTTSKSGFDASFRVYWKAIKSFFNLNSSGAYMNPLVLALEEGINGLIDLMNKYGVEIDEFNLDDLRNEWKKQEKNLMEDSFSFIHNVDTIKEILEFLRNNHQMKTRSSNPHEAENDKAKFETEILNKSKKFSKEQLEQYEEYKELVKHHESFNSKYATTDFIKNLIIISDLAKNQSKIFKEFLDHFKNLLDFQSESSELHSLYEIIALK